MNTSAGLHFPLTPRRRRIKSRRGTAGSPRRNYSLLVGRVRSRLSPTPFLPWKFNDSADLHSPAGVGVPSTSTRKLAATLWQLRRPDVHGGRSGTQCRSRDQFGTRVKSPSDGRGRDDGATKGDTWSPVYTSPSKNGIPYEVAERSMPNPRCGIEGATRWDPKLSVISALQALLFQAQKRIQELESERLSFKKNVENLLRKLGEEKSLWQRREHEKFIAVVSDLKEKLCRERENYQRIEKLNSGLVNELDNAKVSAKQIMQDYEEEKKRRELMEQISKELAKEIGKDKAEMGAWIREALKFQDEMEEERKMLQIAEAWREERVQMKLVDAKLALEHKYCQMNKLVTELETFLQTRSVSLGAMELRKAALIRQAVKSLNINDIYEFSYVPPKSDDVSSITEELTSERGIEHCSPVSVKANEVDKNHMVKHSIVTKSILESDIHKKMLGECGRAKLSKDRYGKKRERGLPLPDSGNINPYITRGTKGCSEWRNGIEKHSSKAKLLEEKIENEKSRLHQVLKPKT